MKKIILLVLLISIAAFVYAPIKVPIKWEDVETDDAEFSIFYCNGAKEELSGSDLVFEYDSGDQINLCYTAKDKVKKYKSKIHLKNDSGFDKILLFAHTATEWEKAVYIRRFPVRGRTEAEAKKISEDDDYPNETFNSYSKLEPGKYYLLVEVETKEGVKVGDFYPKSSAGEKVYFEVKKKGDLTLPVTVESVLQGLGELDKKLVEGLFR